MTTNERITEIEAALKRFLPRDAGLANPVRDAMEYALMAGGKRIRPQLMLMTYDAFMRREAAGKTAGPSDADASAFGAITAMASAVNKAVSEKKDGAEGNASDQAGSVLHSAAGKSGALNRDVPLAFASALEMIHTYSLIHDDLPAMDDDSLRRGRPTVHVAYGEDIAILAGDGLLNIAYEIASDCFDVAPGDVRVERALRILARKPGLFGMLGGQTADVTLAGKPLDDDKLEYIYANKTAALLECAMQIGSVLGGASDAEAEVIRQAAYDAGIAFQVQDDILDMTGTAEELGKEVGQDERNEKTTYVTLHGMEAAERYVQEKTDAATDGLRKLFGLAEGRKNAAAEELIALLQGLVGRRS